MFLLTCIKMRLLFLFAIIAQLLACSGSHRPAPVVELRASNLKAIDSDEYIVKRGETLYSIAWRVNSDIRTIAKINQLKHPYTIFPGQKLLLTEKAVPVSRVNTSKQNSNKYSVKTPEKSHKKPVARPKNEAYGVSVDKEKVAEKQQVEPFTFSQKIDDWQWPASGKLVNTFSVAQQGNNGIDIAGKKGESIVAAADGAVVYVGNALRGYGNLIIIKHNDDYLSAYAHNDTLLVKEQQAVTIGDKIATMGDTDASQVMLHFEIRFRGKSVNPLKYLPKK